MSKNTWGAASASPKHIHDDNMRWPVVLPVVVRSPWRMSHLCSPQMQGETSEPARNVILESISASVPWAMATRVSSRLSVCACRTRIPSFG
jgi:hypothetical protein